MARRKLMFGSDEYTPFALRKKNIRDVRKEYTRLRDIAMKRITRLEKAGLITQTAGERRREGFKKLAQLESDRDIRAGLVALYRYTQINPTGTAEGARKQRAENILEFRKRGVEWINEENYIKVLDFITSVRDQYLENSKKGAGSPKYMEYLVQDRAARQKTLSDLREDYYRWLDQEEQSISKTKWNF